MALDINTYLLLIAGIFLLALIPIFYVAFRTAGVSIFPGSGDPSAMGRILIRALRTTAGIYFGFFGILIITLLLINDYITSENGLPLIASIISYIIGKGFLGI